MYCVDREERCYVQKAKCRGPSPIMPFLLVVLVGLLVCWETLLKYYTQLSKVKDGVFLLQKTLPIPLTIVIFVVIILVGFMNETSLAAMPVLLLFLIFLLQNEILCILVLVLLIFSFAMFYYPRTCEPTCQSVPDMGRREMDLVPDMGRREMDLPFGLSLGVVCYLLMVGCLVACTLLSEDKNLWWSCMAFLLACVLFFNFSGRGNKGWII